MPVSYLEIDGIRYEVPPTRSAIRLLDDDGVTPLLNIDAQGRITTNLSVDGVITVADGGAVTQDTSIATGVELNTASGQITTVSSTLGAGAEASFQVTNNKVSGTDVVAVSLGDYGGSNTPFIFVSAVFNGGFDLTISNLGAGALDSALTINFVVIKGSIT